MAAIEIDGAGQATIARERLAIAFGVALFVAGVILVIAILPAEYGADPTGLGRKLGLMAMSDVQKSLQAFQASRGPVSAAATVVPQERDYTHETIELKLGPRDSVEYKYRLDKGQALLYWWKASGRVNVEFHAEPDGAPQGYAETYEKKSDQQSASGTLTAPFSGIHGWYWENQTGGDVTVTLSAAGFFTLSHEFRKGAATKTKTY